MDIAGAVFLVLSEVISGAGEKVISNGKVLGWGYVIWDVGLWYPSK